MSKLSKGHILIVDDDPEIRDVLKTFLELSSYQVTTCETASEAEIILNNKKFSALLVDIFLPDMDGIVFISNIRKKGISNPVIVITGSSEVEIARKAIQLDVFDYLIKPFKQKQLLQIVNNAVMKNRLDEERVELEGQRQVYQAELEKMIRKKTAELQESEEKYRNLIEQTLVGVFIQENENFNYINHKTCEIIECETENILFKKGIFDFVHPEDLTKVKKHFDNLKTNTAALTSISFRMNTAKQNEHIIEVWVNSRTTSEGNIIYEGLMVDVTEEQLSQQRERQLELQLLNEHKLAAIGRLTAGISHNLNTPISIIQGNAELLKLRFSDLNEIDIILRQTGRMTDIIKTISKKGQDAENSKIIEIDINKMLEDELAFLNANLFFKHHVEKEYDFEDNLPIIQGQYGDLSQGLLHIIQNAIDSVYERDIRKIKISTKSDTENIYIRIEDSGCGIKEEDCNKIYSPFFTTKPKQVMNDDPNKPRGTGLGLNMAKNSLAQYNGTIDFESVVNKGSVFTVTIPITK